MDFSCTEPKEALKICLKIKYVKKRSFFVFSEKGIFVERNKVYLIKVNICWLFMVTLDGLLLIRLNDEALNLLIAKR